MILLIALAGLFVALANGANDNFKGVATHEQKCPAATSVRGCIPIAITADISEEGVQFVPRRFRGASSAGGPGCSLPRSWLWERAAATRPRRTRVAAPSP